MAEKALSALGVGRFFVRLFEILKVITYTEAIEECISPRGKVLWEEAKQRGIQMRAMKLFGRVLDVYTATKDDKTIMFMGLPRPKNAGAVLELLDDKWEMKKRFLKSGIPTPAGGEAVRWSEAKKIFSEIRKPVIVKPRTGSRGRHTTTLITTLEELQKGFKRAKQLCHWVIIEEHLDGPVYRGTVINYELQGVLRGDAPSVIGDGTHTIRELVQLKNETPHPGVADIALSGDTDIFLARQNLALDTIAPPKREIFLTEKIGVRYGGSSSEDFDICHPDTKHLFVEAAKIMGDYILGFDFIIPDITKSYKEQRSGFIECNSLPFINLHHDPLLGTPRNVAAAVWNLAGF